MKRKVHYLLVISTIMGAGAFSLLWSSSASAENSNVTVTIGIDMCGNIAGPQTTIPDGMLQDAGGNCYTPVPVVDVCSNIAGDQATIPAGYYRDASGNCFQQPATPVDVCPNLDGTQTVVPVGYTNNTSGDCVPIPVDRCNNIEGVQTTVPSGMLVNASGACYTPTPQATAAPNTASPDAPATTTTPPDPWVAPSEPRTPPATDTTGGDTTELKNVPEAFAPLVAPLVGLVPGSVKEALRSLPPAVAQTFPYYVFGLLGAGALFMWGQALQEIAAARMLFLLFKKERAIAEQKDNFITLASHYLRTPLAVMTSGLDTIKALKEVPDSRIEALRAPIVNLDNEIKEILVDIEGNKELNDVQVSDHGNTPVFWRSGYFWWPVIISITITVLANFFLGVVGEVEIGTYNMIVQVLIFLMVISFFYTAIRNHYIKKRNRELQEKLVTNERHIDEARNAFIQRATAALQTGLAAISAKRANIDGARSARFFDDGYARFEEMLTKFVILSQIRAGSKVREETFDLREAVEEAIHRHGKKADEQHLTIVNNAPSVEITQRRSLFEFVLGSLLDNAIKYSHTGGTVQINATPREHKIIIKIADYGVGIEKDKLEQLFKPFSRATNSSIEFDYEGLGFSLYLDKIIMDHLGGSIEAESEINKGSTFTVVATTQKKLAKA